MIINCKDVALYPTEYTKKSKYNLSNKVFVDYSYLFFDYTFVYHYSLFKQYSFSVEELSADSCPSEI